ncbi:MAG: cryptochrome/photolyase family protein [Phycisphaerales bacterium]|nr:cryptochrome/photolyase family protein [Phycisphaerales bacterium]
MSSSSSIRKLAFLLGDQLDMNYLDSLGLDQDQDLICMSEVADASENPPSHVQRTVLFLSAMRHFAEQLKDDGWNVSYTTLTDQDNTQNFENKLERYINDSNPEEVVMIEPGSHSVIESIERACESCGVDLDMIEDPHFLCTHDEFNEWASGRKQLTMEYFYREQRKKHDILMDDGEPEGGEWNYDKQNRKSFKSEPDAPDVPRFKPDKVTKSVLKDIQSELPDLPGNSDGFGWAVTREQALECLDDFVSNRLPRFGDYQDAMWSGKSSLYHSLLAPALNLKLLNPREVCQAAVDAYESGDAPINAVEGFIRQIIGWREFIRGVYWFEDTDYADRNELEQYGSLPEFYWDAETDMACIKDAISSVINHAYGHHIERLMITGNFALIAGVEPQQVDAWYRGMYADAIDWVTTPNTIGMAMHADGGVVGTKPYAASGNYVKKMSNHCKGCRFDVKKKVGEDACPFNTFYWDFLIRNEKRFKENHRMSLILKHLDKFSKDDRVELTVHAQELRDEMGIGEIDKD